MRLMLCLDLRRMFRMASPHRDGPLRLTAIHGATAFDTEWLTEPEPVWGSTPER
jgi:hypothetical protein